MTKQGQNSDVPASGSHLPLGRKIEIHNSIIWIRGRKHAILREKLYRVLGSRSWNHGLNGELCPEHFWKGPRNFVLFFFLGGGGLCGRSGGRAVQEFIISVLSLH